MRRFAVEEKRADLLVCARLFRAAPLPKHAAQLMKGFEEAFRGRPMSGLPEELVSAIAASGQAPLALRVRQGEAAAVTDALKLVQDAKAKLDDRLLYARVFGEAKNAAAVPALLATASAGASPAPLRKASLASLSAYDDESIGARVAELLPSLSGDTRTAAFALLASRPAWAQRLLSLVQSGKVRAADVPADVAERLRSSKEKSLAELATKLFPKQTPAEQAATQKRVAEIEVILNRGSANPYAGETIFTERCAGCHKLFFKGGNIGPDLTTYQRDNLGTMLTSIVNPNVEIREGYQYYVVETRDGRTLSGFFVDRDNQVTVLRGLEGENITLRSAEIADLQPMGRSLMPEGLLEGLDDQQLLDFFAFLRSSQPFTR
jgi:putative heme-binding domain-containing protein